MNDRAASESPTEKSGREKSPDEKSAAGRTPEEVSARRRRLAEIFGDDLPDQTSDDMDPPSEADEARSDEWLRRQVPPHHG